MQQDRNCTWGIVANAGGLLNASFTQNFPFNVTVTVMLICYDLGTRAHKQRPVLK